MGPKIPIFAGFVIIFLFSGAVFAGIRCSNDIISVGDTKILVLSKIQSCGQVLDKDSYTKEIEGLSGDDKIKIQKRIDLWSIRVKDRGSQYCYPLTFEDGILTSIGSWNRCN